MFGLTLLDLCAYLGLAAVGAIAVNLLLGILISLRYSPVRCWPYRRVNLFALHQWSAYVSLVLILSHPAVLLFVDKPRFSWFDILVPVRSPLQPVVNTVGAVALYLVVLVTVTSLLRQRMSRKVWRSLHYLVYPATVCLLIHSIMTDPNLKTGHPDLLDGGKIYLYGVVLLLVATSWVRLRLRGRGFRREPRPVKAEAAAVRVETEISA
jgi:predicted ferric reductase